MNAAKLCLSMVKNGVNYTFEWTSPTSGYRALCQSTSLTGIFFGQHLVRHVHLNNNCCYYSYYNCYYYYNNNCLCFNFKIVIYPCIMTRYKRKINICMNSMELGIRIQKY